MNRSERRGEERERIALNRHRVRTRLRELRAPVHLASYPRFGTKARADRRGGR